MTRWECRRVWNDANVGKWKWFAEAGEDYESLVKYLTEYIDPDVTVRQTGGWWPDTIEAVVHGNEPWQFMAQDIDPLLFAMQVAIDAAHHGAGIVDGQTDRALPGQNSKGNNDE